MPALSVHLIIKIPVTVRRGISKRPHEKIGDFEQANIIPGGVLPYKGLMGTCDLPGYEFRDFCLKQGIDFIIFYLNQGIDFINFCLKQGIFSWTINSLRVCSTN